MVKVFTYLIEHFDQMYCNFSFCATMRLTFLDFEAIETWCGPNTWTENAWKGGLCQFLSGFWFVVWKQIDEPLDFVIADMWF